MHSEYAFMKMKEQKVLMTGSHGFVGTNLITALSEKYEIVRWNVYSKEPIPDVDAVIHLAGLAHDTKHTTETQEYFRANTDLTKKIYDQFIESSVKQFIFFSSIKAQDGDTPYAQSKKAAEDYIQNNPTPAPPLKGAGNKKVYILRPCMIHGPGNKGNLNLLFNVVKKGVPWPLAAFENKRSFASMGNVGFIVDRLLCSDVESGLYNICDDEAISTNDLIRLICDCLGKDAHLWRIPKGLMSGLARLGDVFHLPLNTERLGKLTENYIVDNSKIKHALGVESLPVSVRDGLRQTIQSMINDKGNG